MIKNIFFDFDGVILNSMDIRDFGFKEILLPFDKNNNMDDFLKYHRINAGLSRFHKIKYFFLKYLNEKITEEKIKELADKFSEIMRKELINKKYLIKETISFIEKNYKYYNFYIVSGSEQNELRYLCKKLDIDEYFKIILGSSIHKNDLIKNVLKKENLNPSECILVGDSINDYNAARINGIKFYGFNNEDLKKISDFYIKSFYDINFVIINDYKIT